MSKKVKIIIAVVVAILIITPIAGYFLAQSSEPFQFSKQAIQNSASIKQVIGDVRSIKLAPFGYFVKYTGPKGWAEFEVEVVGTKNSGTLNLKLEKNVGTWQIVGARLKGSEIVL